MFGGRFSDASLGAQGDTMTHLPSPASFPDSSNVPSWSEGSGTCRRLEGSQGSSWCLAPCTR